MKAGRHVPCKSDQSQLVQKEKKGEKSPTFLDDDLDFTDTVLMGLDSINDAVLNGRNDVMNLFDFSKWRSVPVEPLGIENMEELETVLYKTSTNVELQVNNELSSLKAIDFFSTIPTEKSTGNALKKS